MGGGGGEGEREREGGEGEREGGEGEREGGGGERERGGRRKILKMHIYIALILHTAVSSPLHLLSNISRNVNYMSMYIVSDYQYFNFRSV